MDKREKDILYDVFRRIQEKERSPEIDAEIQEIVNRDSAKKRLKDARAQLLQAKLEAGEGFEGICRNCGKKFPAFRISARYCSRTCSQAAYWQRRADRVATTRRAVEQANEEMVEKFRAEYRASQAGQEPVAQPENADAQPKKDEQD